MREKGAAMKLGPHNVTTIEAAHHYLKEVREVQDDIYARYCDLKRGPDTRYQEYELIIATFRRRDVWLLTREEEECYHE